MSKKSLNGQMNMFDYFRGLENMEANGDTEMVSLIPNVEFETQVEPEPTSKPNLVRVEEEKEEKLIEPIQEPQPEPTVATKSDYDAVMHKHKTDARGNIISEISYVDYNKVILTKDGATKEYQFDNSKDAVDFYVDEMLKL